MARRRLLSPSTREALFGVPSDLASLERLYVLGDDDRALVRTRRRPENRLGLALHIALLRHPGQGWWESASVPDPLIAWLGDQVAVAPSVLDDYGARTATVVMHRTLAARHLGLRPFRREDAKMALTLAARAAFDSDDGRTIMSRLIDDLRAERLVLPSIDTLERLGIAGRARARRQAAQAIGEALTDSQKAALNGLLANDSTYRMSPLAWLRGAPHSTSASSLHAQLNRLTFIRSLHLPPRLGENIHPVRLAKFAREGAVAPARLLSDFGERRRIATLAAQLLEMEVILTDASVALFERLTAQLFARSKRKHDQSWQASQGQVGRLMRLFNDTLMAMALAREHGDDPVQRIDDDVGWERLMKSQPEVEALSNIATEDPLTSAARRYSQLRRFAPAFLEAFSFSALEASDELNAALELLKALNRTGTRKLPADPPMPFPAKHWKSLILEDGLPNRRTYETAVLATLRDRLRAGDVWVEGSRDYQRFDTYLVPMTEARAIIDETDVPLQAKAWLDERRTRLRQRLHDVGQQLEHDALDGVRIEKGRLKITPHEPVTPPAGEQLDRAIDVVMPRIRITELLWDVARQTRFLDAFTDLRSGRNHVNPAAVLAAILAGATNLGLARMAQASKGVTHAQLAWGSAWYLRADTYSDALARIIDAHHGLAFTRVWGAAEQTSSDGQFFSSARNAGEINAKYGPDPGLKIYSFLSGQYGSFYSRVIGATAGEAPFVLDGLMGNAAQFNPLVHYVDTGGVSDHLFALFHLLGLRLAPRLRNFPERRLACFGKANDVPALSTLMGRPINEEVILRHWNDVLRLSASIKSGAVKSSSMLRKLGAYRQQNQLYLALGEIGRIERTLFMLDWMEDPALRMACQAGLNKGEARHSLARAVFAHSEGRIHDRSDGAQQRRAMALNLVIGAIVYWNTLYIDKAASHLRRTGQMADEALLKHVSPLGWAHISLTGDYAWDSGAAERSNARPLNLLGRKHGRAETVRADSVA